jgi:ABC-type Co2+ transport system, permease component
MHISDGVLPTGVLIAGWILTVLLLVMSIAYSRKKMNNISEKVPQVAVVTAALFVVCLIKIPVGFTSLHLMLAGLAGILLGPLVFACIFISLLLQALLFQFGGITVLGVNSLLMGIPGLVGWLIFKALSKTKMPFAASGALTSVIAVTITTILLGIVFYVSGVDFGSMGPALKIVAEIPVLSSIADMLKTYPALLTFFIIFLVNIPLMIAEGIISAFILPFIEKVKPEILDDYRKAKMEKPD